MEKSKSFTDLMAWQKAHALVLICYEITAKFPREELFGLISQMRRAAVSVPANIAEGFKKKGKSDKIRFMNIAEASLEELKYYFILAKELKYYQTDEIFLKAEEVGKIIYSYCNSITKSI